MFRGRGRLSFPPHTVLAPLREVGVGSNGGLWLPLEEKAQKDVWPARSPQTWSAAPAPRRGGRKEAVGARTGAHETGSPRREAVADPGGGRGVAVRTPARVSGGAEGGRAARARLGSRGEMKKARLGSVRSSPDGKLCI